MEPTSQPKSFKTTLLKILIGLLVVLGAMGILGTAYIIITEGTREPPRPDLELSQKIETLAPQVPLSILITRNKHRIYTEHWPADTDRHHRYHLAEAGDMFTAMAAAVLLDVGKLTLTDPITQWLEDLDPAYAQITLEHLLSHRSGLNGKLPPVVPNTAPGGPGERVGANYQMIERLITKVTGGPAHKFIDESVVKPLALEHTSYDPNSGQWLSCPEDWLLFELALNTNTIIRMETYLRFFTTPRLENGRYAQFALGWRVQDYRGLRLEQMEGVGPEANHVLTRFSQKNFSIIIMSELDQERFKPANWATYIADLYLDREMSKPRTSTSPL